MATVGDVLAGRAAWAVDAGDCLPWLRSLPGGCVQACVSSPPYFGLRRYLPKGHPDRDREVGTEETPADYVVRLVEVFGEVRRVLRDDGVLLLNLGDSYATNPGNGRGGKPERATLQNGGGNPHRSGTDKSRLPGLKPKDLIGVPWMAAFALRDAGWYLRSEMIWHKLAPMPESVRDRPTKAHEQVFLLAKRGAYFWDGEAVKLPPADSTQDRAYLGKRPISNRQEAMQKDGMHGKSDTLRVYDRAGANLRSVLSLGPEPCRDAHFAVMPAALASVCVRASTSARGCCPACGAPWRRVVRKGGGVYTGGSRRKHVAARPGQGVNGALMTGVHYLTETLGWQPSCACPPADPAGCVVLDPFAGSGTTGVVARQLGRRFLGCDLNQAYADLARRRVGAANPLADFADAAPRPQATLFGEEAAP